MAIDREAWDARIRAAVEELTPQLIATSHDIHGNPELAFREHRASARLADELEQGGFTVERGAGELPTAFKATVGDGPLNLAICAECLPVWRISSLICVWGVTRMAMVNSQQRRVQDERR